MRKVVIFAMYILVSIFHLEASPAFRIRKVVMQSDGTLLTVIKMGNEDFSYYVTLDSIPIIKGKDGIFFYARFNTADDLVTDTVLAHNKELRTPDEAVLALELRTEFRWRLMMKVGKQRYGVGVLSEASVNSLGAQHLPVILVQFEDVKFVEANDTYKFTDDAAFFERHFNEENYKDEGAGSVRDYFISQSDSLFRPTFDIIGPVTLSNKMAYYGGNNSSGSDGRVIEMMQEAISKALESGADFSKYATSSKGIPFVAIIYAGYGEQASDVEDAVWARYESKLYYNAGNYTFRSALCTNEIADYNGHGVERDGIGTFCHELSHALGLPDFYNASSVSNVFGLDYWDIMDYGQFWNDCKTPVGYSAYERNFMKWLKIDTLQTYKQLVNLPSLSSRNAHRAYKIINENDATGNEYYILENRQSSPWFSNDFGNGMLIYHVDYDVDDWTSNDVNNDENHQRMTILPADGVLTSYSDAQPIDYQGDLFPGAKNVTELSDNSIPSDTAYVGKYMHRKLKKIQQIADGTISFYYMSDGKMAEPVDFSLTHKSDKEISVSWLSASENDVQSTYVLCLKHDNILVTADTVSVTSFTFQNLFENTSYTIELKAIAPDYIDSDVQAMEISTYPTDVHLLSVEHFSDKIEVFAPDGRYLGMKTKKAFEESVHRYGAGIYLVRDNGQWKKVLMK